MGSILYIYKPPSEEIIMLDIKIRRQPDDETCGPTCLHAIYRYYGKEISLKKVVDEVERSSSGGTFSPLLGKHALKIGFKATIYINNMTIFDPSWFTKSEVSNEILLAKLDAQSQLKHSPKLTVVSKAFHSFLKLGGSVRFQTVDVKVLKDYFDKKIPILTGLNATYLYRTRRECYTKGGEAFFDDMMGEPTGHFVVLCGYTEKRRQVVIADPFRDNPLTPDENPHYKVSMARLINAIMLGVVSYDADLLIIEPKSEA